MRTNRNDATRDPGFRRLRRPYRGIRVASVTASVASAATTSRSPPALIKTGPGIIITILIARAAAN